MKHDTVEASVDARATQREATLNDGAPKGKRSINNRPLRFRLWLIRRVQFEVPIDPSLAEVEPAGRQLCTFRRRLVFYNLAHCPDLATGEMESAFDVNAAYSQAAIDGKAFRMKTAMDGKPIPSRGTPDVRWLIEPWIPLGISRRVMPVFLHPYGAEIHVKRRKHTGAAQGDAPMEETFAEDNGMLEAATGKIHMLLEVAFDENQRLGDFPSGKVEGLGDDDLLELNPATAQDGIPEERNPNRVKSAVSALVKFRDGRAHFIS
jgi:hypothetical protein